MAGPDWSLLQNPNFAGNALRYQEAGREARMEDGTRNALAKYAQDPEAGIAELMPYDPRTALSLRKDQQGLAAERRRREVLGSYGQGDVAGARQAALAEGDVDLLKIIDGMDESQRKQAQQRAETLASVAFSLRDVPYEQRASRLAAMRGQLGAIGITPEQLQGFDPTDEAIDTQVGIALDLKGQLEEANRQRDDRRAQAQFDETRRHNRAGEGVAAGNLGLRREAHAARLRGVGGYGTAGVGAVIPDDDVEIDP